MMIEWAGKGSNVSKHVDLRGFGPHRHEGDMCRCVEVYTYSSGYGKAYSRSRLASIASVQQHRAIGDEVKRSPSSIQVERDAQAALELGLEERGSAL